RGSGTRASACCARPGSPGSRSAPMSRDTHQARLRRHARVRKKVSGTAERPRLAVFRSNKHTYAQVVDDVAGRTLAAASTQEALVRDGGAKPVDAAREVGRLVGER